jgi:hypothetical protein
MRFVADKLAKILGNPLNLDKNIDGIHFLVARIQTHELERINRTTPATGRNLAFALQHGNFFLASVTT